ncbi:T9SS C-terminal target domain-containing protein [Xanthomarina sp. F2636L]|uniref:T9SS C-terminal target domain-containing protein n=1 Tax=Xanthomarina sp. F2636L TaxID=2996018 RepID=UPI00225DDB31|nr:T9SS C-terminal target domain-containing protein [Xanthomarina sp. F2636L]MCX7550099.1 T9SS C-terminal target domain-containing protein [Xanthomarina sp. F2636L]
MIKKLTYVALLMCSSCFSQSYPVEENIMKTTWKAYEIPDNDPVYLEPFTNTFGKQVTRVSDVTIIGEDSKQMRHHYSVDSPWNSDETYIKLSGYPAAILDGSTYKFIKWADIPASATWANTKPNVMYGVTKNKLVSYNIVINTIQTLHTFSDFEKISYGFNKGNMSYDDRYIGLIGKNGNDLTLIVFNLENGQIEGTDYIGDIKLAWFSVSPLGNYAVATFGEDGSLPNQGIKAYDIDMTNKRHINNYSTHSDLGIDAEGNEVYVAFGDETTRPNGYFMKMVRLSDGLTTPLFNYTIDNGVWNGHISCRNINRPGWAYVSEGCCETIGKKELFAIKLDSSNTIERFGLHHAMYHDGYQQQPQAVPNRDGTKIMFASSWNGLFTTRFPPAFIVEKK